MKDLRIFVSSTFSDMHEERDILIKKVFPKLNSLTRSRGYNLGSLDLRWGITDSEIESGNLITLCLEGIDACRPLFIGILGGRYGSTVDSFDRALILKYPFLQECNGMSITEIEIKYGALSSRENNAGVFFYAKPELNKEVSLLSNKIKDAGFAIKTYESLQIFESTIFTDLDHYLKSILPDNTKYRHSQRLDLQQTFLLNTYTKFYAGSNEVFNALDTYLYGKKQRPLFIHGEAGIGKTAILASWVNYLLNGAYAKISVVDKKFNFLLSLSKILFNRRTPSLIAYHIINPGTESNDLNSILIRFVQKLSSTFNIDSEIEGDHIDMRRQFIECLHKVPKSDLAILILDGIDNLKDEQQAHHLGWLPNILPSNIKIVVSTKTGTICHERLIKNSAYPLTLSPLKKKYIKSISEEYLGFYGKKLELTAVSNLEKFNTTSIPLYLIAILEELRITGRYETINQQILDYLGANSLSKLLERIVQRLIIDSSQPQSVLTILTVLSLSRKGITLSDLKEFLITQNQDWVDNVWWPAYLSLQSFIIEYNGKIQIISDDLKSAIDNCALDHGFDQIEIATSLKNFWLTRNTVSTIEEYPWLCVKLTCPEELVSFFKSQKDLWSLNWEQYKYELLSYLTWLNNKHNIKALDLFDLEQLDSSVPKNYFLAIIDILAYQGNLKQAIAAIDKSLLIAPANGSFQFSLLLKKVELLSKMGKDEEIIQLVEILYGDYPQLTNTNESLRKIELQILMSQGSYALIKDKLQAELSRKEILNYDNAFYHGILAVASANLGLFKEANRHLDNQSQIASVLGLLDLEIEANKNRGKIAHLNKKTAKATKYLNIAVILAEEIGDINTLVECEFILSDISSARADYDNAIELLESIEQRSIESNNYHWLYLCYMGMADIFGSKVQSHTMGRKYYDKAQDVYSEHMH